MRSLNPWSIFPTDLDAPVTRSLSIQFILQTLIDGFDIVRELKSSTIIKGHAIREELKKILDELQRILLFTIQNPMGQKIAILDKLSYYSEILIEASQVQSSELTFELEQMRKSLLGAKAKMMMWKKMPGSYPLDEMLEQIMQLYSTLQEKFCQYFIALTPYLKEARSDENVLISLIENKEKLNSSLGPKHIEKLLQSFFPAGFDQLRAVINEGYTRRGFNTFLSSVEQLIDEIQWETACQIPNQL